MSALRAVNLLGRTFFAYSSALAWREACKLLSLTADCAPPLRLTRRAYRAAVVSAYGQPAVLQNVSEELVVGKTDVLIDVHGAGVNTSDSLMVRGLHHDQPKLPFTPGFELAGVVVKVGQDVRKFKPGDRVLALKTRGLGAFAELCTADERETFAIGHSLDYRVACALPSAYGSAYLTLSGESDLQDRTVLVITSQGATGVAVVDLALNVFRCHVIAACDTEAKCATVRPYGVQSTVEYADEDVLEVVDKVTKHEGVDVLIDTVGLLQTMDCLKPGGRYISLGFVTGKVPEINLQRIIKSQLTIRGVWFGGYARQNPKGFGSIIEKMLKLHDEEYISPCVGATYRLDQVNDALQCLTSRSVIGKVVISMD